MNIKQYIDGITYTAEFIPFSKSRNKNEKNRSLNWEITLSDGHTEFKTDYMQGIGHLPGYDKLKGPKTTIHNDNLINNACETGRKLVDHDYLKGTPIDKPKIEDILYSLLMDSVAIDVDFEDWAGNFGYETDSRKAEKIYNDCVKIGLKMRKLFGGKLEALRNEFIDY